MSTSTAVPLSPPARPQVASGPLPVRPAAPARPSAPAAPVLRRTHTPRQLELDLRRDI